MQNMQTQADSNALRPAHSELSTTFSAANLSWITARIQAGELSKPGPDLDDFTRKLLIGLWLETLDELGPEKFDAAYKQVLKNSTFRPDIAEIRKAAGINRGIQDPIERKAMSELRYIIASMRVHGQDLKPLPGRVLNGGKDANGLILQVPLRTPKVPAPTLEPKTEAAIREMGMGSREAGLELIACHPAVNKECDPRFRVKNAGEIEKRWVQAFAGVR